MKPQAFVHECLKKGCKEEVRMSLPLTRARGVRKEQRRRCPYCISVNWSVQFPLHPKTGILSGKGQFNDIPYFELKDSKSCPWIH